MTGEGGFSDSASTLHIASITMYDITIRLYEQDAHPVANDCGVIQEIHIARTAISLSQTESLKAVSFEEEDEPMGIPSFSYKWHYPQRTDEGSALPSSDIAEADVGLLFQTTSGQTVWVYAPFGPYVGTAIYHATAGNLLPEELAEVVELVPLAARTS